MPLLVMQGERDYQVLAAKDFAGWETALQGNANVTLKLYPELNHLLIAGEGPSTPQEYQTAGHVSQDVIDSIHQWIEKGSKK
jgi:alpha-beta hydrolase superfamily lysophospholipase